MWAVASFRPNEKSWVLPIVHKWVVTCAFSVYLTLVVMAKLYYMFQTCLNTYIYVYIIYILLKISSQGPEWKFYCETAHQGFQLVFLSPPSIRTCFRSGSVTTPTEYSIYNTGWNSPPRFWTRNLSITRGVYLPLS